jgi:phage baseplate assembly protein W
MAGLAVKLPVTVNTTDGFELIKTYEALAAQNLKMLVLTTPGERIMDPDFGVGARRYLFENMHDSTFQSFKSRLMSQQKKYLPYLTIESVDFLDSSKDPNLQDNFLGVRIQYYNNALNTRDALTVRLTT